MAIAVLLGTTTSGILMAQNGEGFVVNTTDDASDGLCDASHCSLREAIEAANANADTNIISFNIPGVGVQTIQPTSPLPFIANPVIIDGTTQPGYSSVPLIELDGSTAVSPIQELNNGLSISAGGSTVTGLVINHFGFAGIALIGGSGNTITGNYIGTDSTGTTAAGNRDGVYVLNSASNTIGGASAEERNVISGNHDDGINLEGAGSNGNTIIGNYIGINAAGTAALGNGDDGIKISSAPNNTIGDTSSGARNTISGNHSDGIYITGTASGNLIIGNNIGTNPAGTAALGNTGNGVQIDGTANTIIGTTAPGAHNLISGNENGVVIQNPGATGNVVSGNYIGTNAAGTAALGNTHFGVVISLGAGGNTVGGVAAGAGNLISGNNPSGSALTGAGVRVSGDGNTVQDNYIGSDGTEVNAIGNGFAGIWLDNATNSTIGGTTAAARNLIAFNNGYGIYIGDNLGGSTGNRILRNSIHSNTGLGIDLNGDGITANDAGDTDTGANNLQNYPVLQGAFKTGPVTSITGLLDSAVNTEFRVEFFSNTTCDASGNGEGRTFLGFITQVTDASGQANLMLDTTASISLGQFITATATDPQGNTSEFSACAQVIAPMPTHTPTATVTPSFTPTLSFTPTFTPTFTPSVTPTPSITPTHSPPNIAPLSGYYTSTTVRLSWNRVSWAVGYVLQVDDNADFSSPSEYDVAAGVQWQDVTVPGDGEYYWRVRAKNDMNTITPWSAVQRFRVSGS